MSLAATAREYVKLFFNRIQCDQRGFEWKILNLNSTLTLQGGMVAVVTRGALSLLMGFNNTCVEWSHAQPD